ncbi:hypothetical protein [Sphaerothrix gracilis]|uniref:hypothetical protein n=1 Tax=Sphaerothrix gracilis TaxID=3151835 RepID=UPI0031FE15BC
MTSNDFTPILAGSVWNYFSLAGKPPKQEQRSTAALTFSYLNYGCLRDGQFLCPAIAGLFSV